jgi:glutamine amidotransferase
MTASKIAIVDYGLGNLSSVRRAFEVCGVDGIVITNNAEEILNSERVVLPGVGAFADGIQGLTERGLDNTIRAFAASRRPLLGICLGMQLFATRSLEFGDHAGLDLIPGKVSPISGHNSDGGTLKIPYIGWSPLKRLGPVDEKPDILVATRPDDSVYLVHSFQFVPASDKHILATYRYGNQDIVAAVRKDNITGLQFHPEKSGEVGLSILRKFVHKDFLDGDE